MYFTVIDHTVNLQKKVQIDEEKELTEFDNRNLENLESSDAKTNHSLGSTFSSENLKYTKPSRRQSDIVGCSNRINIEQSADMKLRGFSWDG